MKRTGIFVAVFARDLAMAAGNGKARPSSPTQYSKRSPRI